MMPPMQSESDQRRRARMRLLDLAMVIAIAIGGCTQSSVPIATQKPTTNGRVGTSSYASRT